MSESVPDASDQSADIDEGSDSAATLRAQVEVLEAENERLREEYAAARRTQYRNTALALGVVGVLAAVVGVLFPNARTVLFALGGTGIFVAILTYYLTPEQFLPASLGRSVYETLADNEAQVVSELGLGDERVYVPTEERTKTRLFVPHHAEYEVPDSESLQDVFVVTDDERERGLALRPTGAALVDEFERALTGDFGSDAATVTEQVTDALVEQFEVVDSTETDIDSAAGRATVGVTGSAYGAVDRFDHPVASTVAVALAQGLGTAVQVETESGDDGSSDYLVTCYWDAEDSD